MALPVVKHPTYSKELKYHGKVKFRNYLNKEHKALLTAVELGDDDTVFNTTLDIVNACADIDATLLTEAELEFMFLQIYTKSVQNKVEGNYSCDNVVEREVETTNDDGEVVWLADYEAWGETRVKMCWGHILASQGESYARVNGEDEYVPSVVHSIQVSADELQPLRF